MHYEEHFRGKVVYCNCDDPEYSEFWKFFMRVVQPWGLKKLIATHYEPNAENFSYMITAEPDADENFDWQQEPVRTPLPCNGDFRSSACIELLKDWGYDVIEGKLAIADIMQAAREGKLEEVFGTGTAAVVSPVKELVWKGEHAYIGDGKIGPVTQKLYDTMTGMQWGKIPDTKGWIVPVEKKY